MSKVVIIGGGVIGLSTAWELHKRGADVTVIDARAAGTAASSANAGWIALSLTGPVPAPGLIGTSLKWMFDPDSPLYIRPRANPAFLAWLLRFCRACTSSRYDAGLAATSELGRGTTEIMDQWLTDGVKFEIHDYGRLWAYSNPATMETDLTALQRMSSYGFDQPQPMYGDDLHQYEPSLTDKITAGFHLREDRTVQPVSLVQGLIDALTVAGVSIQTGTPVTELEISHKRAVAVKTTTSRFAADHVVIAAGAWSGQIARLAGVRIPIEAAKGYGLDFAPAPVTPKSAISLRDAKIAISPFEDRLRCSGSMELAGLNEQLTQRRVQNIANAARRDLAGFGPDVQPTHVWSGLRPLAPDGLPVLGFASGVNNLAIATGHAMLGVALAATTSVQMAELITTGTTPDVLKPFSPSRFKGLL